MRPFDNLPETALVDALAEYTARYTTILTEGGEEQDFLHCRDVLLYLLAEIDKRRTSGQPTQAPKERLPG